MKGIAKKLIQAVIDVSLISAYAKLVQAFAELARALNDLTKD